MRWPIDALRIFARSGHLRPVHLRSLRRQREQLSDLRGLPGRLRTVKVGPGREPRWWYKKGGFTKRKHHDFANPLGDASFRLLRGRMRGARALLAEAGAAKA